jgi:Maltokinase N-terminal cap domain
MATIHATTMAPTKLELLAGWLPRQPWYRGGGPPSLSKAGGFRLDDPAGEVGIEFMFVADADGASYHVPVTYRGAPLAGAEEGLIGTSEHGVLGTRWIHDAAHDPIAVAVLLDFLRGDTVAQHQSTSDTPDPSVVARWDGTGRPTAADPSRVESDRGRTSVALTGDHALDIVRVLVPAEPAGAETGLGRVEADWTGRDGSTLRGPVAVVR